MPLDSPRRVVLDGPYRWVRNPMYVGGCTLLAGAGLFLRSPGIVALTVGRGVLGLGLLAAGGVAAARTARARRGVPAKVDGRADD